MKPARIIILMVAIVSAGLAGFLAFSLSSRAPEVVPSAPVKVEVPEPTVNILVAGKSLPVGSRLNENVIHWAKWPKSAIINGLITQESRPEAVRELNGAVVRLPIFDGEPVRQEKIADSSGRIMSALLPAGKRAVATEISAATGVGGLILPNDRVDVLMVRKIKNGGGDMSSSDRFLTETVLSNVRVLAIDQQIETGEDGKPLSVGTTATLELTADQSRVIAVAQKMADRLLLTLRSIADAQEPDTTAANGLLGAEARSSILVIKSGSIVKSDDFSFPLMNETR